MCVCIFIYARDKDSWFNFSSPGLLLFYRLPSFLLPCHFFFLFFSLHPLAAPRCSLSLSLTREIYSQQPPSPTTRIPRGKNLEKHINSYRIAVLQSSFVKIARSISILARKYASLYPILSSSFVPRLRRIWISSFSLSLSLFARARASFIGFS